MTSSILPLEPMTPIRCERLPTGDEWGYQLKWDGVRIISHIDTSGSVHLYSRKMLGKNDVYPEIVALLQEHLPAEVRRGGLVLDGEAVVFDPQLQRPVFQLVLQRERSQASRIVRQRWPAAYVLFDILYIDGEDLRSLPYLERHRRLSGLLPERKPSLFVSDLFTDGEALWRWVEEHDWEGVVAKRLTSPYRSGKKHSDWYKKKTALLLDVSIVGIVMRSGQPASMVMMNEHGYLGRVSLGLSDRDKQMLLRYAEQYGGAPMPFASLPAELARERLVWLSRPFSCRVTGLEITAAGLLRHPKLMDFRLPTVR